MQKGLVAKMLDYHKQNHPVDFRAAFDTFFGKNKGDDEIVGNNQALFFEWLVFDFRLPSGKSFLENYLAENVAFISRDEANECKGLIETNLFGIFEILKIQKGKGMLIEDVVSGLKYDVKEKSGTYQVHDGDLVFSRVGKIGDHWEFVGGKITSLGQFGIDRRISNQWKNDKNEFTPKTIFELFYSDDEKNSGNDGKYFNLESDANQTRENLKKFLEKEKLDEHVSVELVEKWIYEEGEKGAILESSENLALVFFGIMLDRENRNELIGEISPLLVNFANTSARKRFKGKSPQQMQEKNKKDDIAPEWRSSLKQISADGVDFFGQGSILMTEQEFDEAQMEFERGFASLLNEKVPIIDAYRAYANMAVCFLAQGNVARGKKLLKISLELNPSYGFAKNTSQKLKNGFFDQMIKFGREISQGKKWKNDVDFATAYYDFLKSTGINFATKEPPVERVSTLNGKKIPRNMSCPCGSGKKFKNCCINL